MKEFEQECAFFQFALSTPIVSGMWFGPQLTQTTDSPADTTFGPNDFEPTVFTTFGPDRFWPDFGPLKQP